MIKNWNVHMQKVIDVKLSVEAEGEQEAFETAKETADLYSMWEEGNIDIINIEENN